MKNNKITELLFNKMNSFIADNEVKDSNTVQNALNKVTLLQKALKEIEPMLNEILSENNVTLTTETQSILINNLRRTLVPHLKEKIGFTTGQSCI